MIWYDMIWYDNMRIHLLCIHKRISCGYTRDLLCMHNTLVHALGQGTQGPGHAQECCACTRDLLCIRKRFFCVYTINVFSYYHIISQYYIIWLYYYYIILLYGYNIIFLCHNISLDYQFSQKHYANVSFSDKYALFDF